MEFVSKTDVGIKRNNNEDSLYAKIYDENTALYIVADGLGGYASGEVASQMLTTSISKYIEEHLRWLKDVKDIEIENVLKNSLTYANSQIYELEKTDEKYQGMGTTVVAVLFINKKIYYLSVGDSRIYYVDSNLNSIKQITVDDTYVNELIRTNVIDESEADNHPQKHILTKAVGILKNIDTKVEILQKKDGYLLLCTDGVTNMLKDEEILNIFKKNKFNNIANKIISNANNNGGVDNITVVVVKY